MELPLVPSFQSFVFIMIQSTSNECDFLMSLHIHRYSSLRTNLPRQIMSFSDFPFVPEVMGDKSHDSRRFPSHTEVQAWLNVFAARYDLRRHIQFNSRVTSLRPITLTNTNSSSDAPAAADTAPTWKLTVQRNSAPAVLHPAYNKAGNPHSQCRRYLVSKRLTC